MSDASNNEQGVTTPKEEEVYDVFVPSIPLHVREPGENRRVVIYQCNECTGDSRYWAWSTRLDKFNESLKANRIPEDNFYELLVDLLVMSITLDGKPVERPVFQGWGLKLKDIAFKKCQTVNGITKAAVDKVGNSSSNAESTSTGSALPAESEEQLPKPAAA